jgi:hypothetical protein
MNNILIAGAGQLGSRHLQGVKTSKYEMDIWVYDLSLDSLKIAEDRYKQVESPNKKDVHFVTNLNDVPKNLDIAIVASSSKPRYSIVTQLLASHNVKYMILEKFLFPRLSDYVEIGKLLIEKGVKTWVNCPRRMWDGYNYIKSIINGKQPIEYTFAGGEWGMCCNTIHFIDIFMMLNGEDSFIVDLNNLDKEVVDSKRPGYVEVHGTELFYTNNGSKLSLSSTKSFDGIPHVVISNDGNLIEYFEGTGEIKINGFPKKVNVHYQSGLTGILIDELLDTGSCRLASYAQSSKYHVAYLSQIAPFINKIKGWTSDSCPIT